MKLFSATFLLFFMISREVVSIPVNENAAAPYSSILFRGAAADTRTANTALAAPTTAEGGLFGTVSWKEKFQNSLISFLPNFPEGTRMQILMGLKALLTSYPGSSLIVVPLINEVVKYATRPTKDKSIIPKTDSTDALIFKLMVEKMDEKNSDQFLEIAAESSMVKEVMSNFLNSLQRITDKLVVKYEERIKSKELKVE